MNATARPLYPREQTGYPLYRRLGRSQRPRTGAENLAPAGIRSPERPARCESLYRLPDPGPLLLFIIMLPPPPPPLLWASLLARIAQSLLWLSKPLNDPKLMVRFSTEGRHFSRPNRIQDLGAVQPPLQWVPGAFPLTIHVHIVQSSWMRGAIPPLPHIPTKHGT